MFDTQPSIFDLPTYLRKKPLVTGSPPEQSQPRQPVKVPYRPLAQAYSSQTTDTTPLIFRALAHPSQRRPIAAAAASSSTFPAPQSQIQPASAPAPSQPPAQPPQTPPTARTVPQSTEEEDPKLATAPKEAARVESESSLRDQSPVAGPSPQPSRKPTAPTPQSPSQPPSTPAPSQPPAQSPQTPSPTASPAPQSTEEEAPKVAAVPKEATEPQSPTTSAPSFPQSPSQSPTPPAPSQPPALPPQSSEETDPKAVDAVNKAAAQVEADAALRKERQPRRTLLESAGQRGTATSLEALEDEVRTRHAELVKKFPQRGPEYEAGMKALLQHIQQQEAQIKAKAVQLPEIAARIYQQWGKGVAGNWITEQALREKDRDSPGAPLSQSHLDALDQEAAKYGLDPKDLRHHLEMLRISDWSRGDTSAPVRHGPGGSIWVNPDRFLDENAYRQAVQQSGGSEAEKAAALDRFPEMQQRAAQAQLGVLRTLGVYNQWEAAQPEGMSDAQKLAQFQKEHSGIFSTGAWKVRLHQALLGVASGVIGLAKSAVGAYEAATGSQGAMDLYRKLSNDAASISASSSALPTGQWVHMGTSMVVSSAPSLGVGGLTSLTLKAGGAAFGLRTAAQVAQAAQTWGLRGAAATSGLQTFGSMYGDAVQGYMKRGDSEATALNKAFIPALAGAASTYLLTAAGGTQGIEALLRQPAFKENFRQWFKAVAAGSVKEGLREEAPDQLIQGIIERYTHNPDKPWKDIIEETLHAGIGGALLGGAVEATTTGLAPAKTSQDQPQPSIPSNTTPVTPDGSVQPSSAPPVQPTTPPKSVEDSKKLIENVSKMPPQAQQHPKVQADLNQAHSVVAEASRKLIENVSKMRPEAQQHPTVQRDLAQAKKIVQDQVQRLENQTSPLSDAQKKELADAKTALARLAPEGSNAQPEKAATAEPPTPGAPQPQNTVSGSRLQFSQGGADPKPTADSDIVDTHRSLSQDEDAFQLGKSKPDTSKMSMPDALAVLAESFSQKGGNELRVKRGGGETSTYYMVTTPRGTAYFDVDPDAKTLRINSAILDSDSTKSGGGSNVYQLAATFAHQHGLKVVADHTVSPKAQKRRISQMVSSMLRHGTSDHFDGSVPFQDAETGETKTELPGWKPGDHDHNLALALRQEHDIVMAEARARGIDLSHLTYDPKTHNIINGHTGTALTEGTLQSLVERFEPGDSGVGKTTLLRALVTGSALQGRRSDGSIQPLHENPGGDPGGQGTGAADRDMVRLARGLYYSRPSGGAGGVPARRMGDALSERPGGLATAVADVSDHLKTQVPGLLNDRTHVFHSVEDLLNSDYAKQHPFSKEDLEKLHSAEGFHDPKTGHSVVIAGNVELRPGETPHDALTRVILHERVGHDGLQTLLGSKDSQAQKHWEGLTQRIPQAELDAIASQQGYQHLKDNPTALAHEWFARQAEKAPHLLKKPGLLRDMWEAFKAQLRKMSNSWKNTDESHLDTHLQELLRHSRKAALQTPYASQPRSPRT